MLKFVKLVVILAVAMLVAYSIYWHTQYGPFAHRMPGLEEISRRASLKLPADCVLLESTMSVWTGFELAAKLSMPRCEARRLLHLLPGEGRVSSKYRMGINNRLTIGGRALLWWRPDSVRRFVAATTKFVGTGSGPKLMRILVSAEEADSAVVYLYCQTIY